MFVHPFESFEVDCKAVLSFKDLKGLKVTFKSSSSPSRQPATRRTSQAQKRPSGEEPRRAQSGGRSQQRSSSPSKSIAVTPLERRQMLSTKQTQLQKFFTATPSPPKKRDRRGSRGGGADDANDHPSNSTVDDNDADFGSQAEEKEDEDDHLDSTTEPRAVRRRKAKEELEGRQHATAANDEERGPPSKQRRASAAVKKAEDDDLDFVDCTGPAQLSSYRSQADYNATLLSVLRAHYQDISRQSHLTALSFTTTHCALTAATRVCLRAVLVENREALQAFWELSHCKHLSVSLCALLFNGATSFRMASDAQRKRFRAFTRQLGPRLENAKAKDIESYDIRERGVQKCIAVLFVFHPNQSELLSPHPFILPVWRAKSAEPIHHDYKALVSTVLLHFLANRELLKVTFEAKELLCVLLRFFGWSEAPDVASLVDAQVGAWLLSPNAGEKNRAKYQLPNPAAAALRKRVRLPHRCQRQGRGHPERTERRPHRRQRAPLAGHRAAAAARSDAAPLRGAGQRPAAPLQPDRARLAPGDGR